MKKELSKIVEQKVAKKGLKLKDFIAKAEKDLSETLKKDLIKIKSPIRVELFGNHVKIHLKKNSVGLGDVILYLEENQRKTYKDKYRIMEIYTPGVRRSLNSQKDRDTLILAGALMNRLGTFGTKVKKYVATYNEKYKMLTEKKGA